MARNRSGLALIDDAMARADVEGETARHPRAGVLRYVNQGYAELRDLLIDARGKSYYRATAWSFTTTADTNHYTTSFPPTFMRMISVRVENADGDYVAALEAMQPLEEPHLLASARCSEYPTHYELRPLGISLYPQHDAGLTITFEWIASTVDVTDSSSSYVDGVDGWEEYIVAFAARCIAFKDEEYQLAGALLEEMNRLAARIKKMAPHRDAFRPRRVQDVRGARMFGRMRGGGSGLQ